MPISNAQLLKQMAKEQGFTKEDMKAYRQIAKDTAKIVKEKKRVNRRELSKSDWTAQELKDHKKALRRIYYEKNKDKILQRAKDRRAVKTVARVAVRNVLVKAGEYKKPVRKPNAYNQFVKTNFNLVKFDNPTFKFAQITKKLGQMWALQKKK
jgi:hypothetical protein